MAATESDWDITADVGWTALFVATARALEAKKSEPLVADLHAEDFCRGAGGDWARVLDGNPPADHRLTGEFGEFFVNYQAARTKYLDQRVSEAINGRGACQLVILGAGLDSRSLRLDLPETTVIYELDQPKVLDFKAKVLVSQSKTSKTTRRAVPVDLRDDWPTALKESGFDPALPSVWLIEGLLHFLSTEAQESILQRVNDLAAPGSSVALEQMCRFDEAEVDTDSDEQDPTKAAFLTLVRNQDKEEASSWLSRHGWTADQAMLESLIAKAQRPLPAARSEGYLMMSAFSFVSAHRP